MAIKMIARRTIYRSSERKEYKAGDQFTVADKDEAERLVRRRKAEIAPKQRNRTDIPKLAPQTAEDPKPAGNEYLRRDMTAQD